jgi:hypothetical protein
MKGVHQVVFSIGISWYRFFQKVFQALEALEFETFADWFLRKLQSGTTL